MSRTHAPSGWMYRTHDPEELHEQLWGWVTGGGTGWDIGANEGQSVDKMLNLGFESVIALEPAIESFRILSREWGSHKGVLLLNKAAGEKAGKVKLSVRGTPMTGGQLVSPELPGVGWHGPELYQREVQCTTLDDLQQEYGTPDFIKIDTEGFEVQILNGAAKVLRVAPALLVEFHSRELREECLHLIRRNWKYSVKVIANQGSPGNGWIIARAFPGADRTVIA